MRAPRFAVLLAACSLGLATPARPEDVQAGTLPGRLGVERGICVLLGETEGKLAVPLARAGELTLYVQLPGGPQVQTAARAADEAGLYGTRIYVEQGTPARIGLADNLADALVAPADLPGLARPEVLRVLRPGGRAIVGPEVWIKPRPEGVDDWPYHYHGPDNNPQSRDRLARAPYLTQYIAEPRYAPGPQAAVAAGGRVFMAFGHVAWHRREEPWMNTLAALDGYNGTLLWRRPLVPGIMVDRSTMIATPDALYLADDRSCKLLDPATGRQLDEIAPPARAAGGTFWKWMALDGGVLYALIGEAEHQDPDAKWRREAHGWPWDGISRGYNRAQYAWGFGGTLLAIDPKSKRILWSRREDTPMDSRATCLAAGRLYVSSYGKYLRCLDAASGRVLWQRTAEHDPEIFETIGPYRPGHGYIGGWKSTVYLKATDKALYFLGPQVEWLTALSAADGRVLWKHPAKDLHLVIRDEGLFVIGAQNSEGQTEKLDPLTGKVLASYPTKRRACTRSTGTAESIFFRAFEGSGRLDCTSGAMQWISTMRPSCHVGVIVAGGELYWLPWVCDCNLQMFGAISLAPAGKFDFDRPATDAERLETAGASGDAPALTVDPNDWPTYRADNARTARTAASIPAKARLLWTYRPASPVEPTAPVAAGGLVFVSGADGIVRALDAATGEARWTAYAGGPVRYPPTIADGRAYVGSGDGWVYAFDAATGRLRWRFRAAPAERRINVFGTLSSTWPVASGVLVDHGVAYFAAGITDQDGTHVYALDAAGGRLRWQNNTCGHLDAANRRGVACQGEMLLAGGRLYLAGGNTVSPGVFDPADGRCLNAPPQGMGATAIRGRELTFADGRVEVSGQPLYSHPDLPVFDKACQWRESSILAANARLTWTAQRPDSPSPWLLTATSPDGRALLWYQPLPAEPVRWGVALDAAGRIPLSLRDGRLLCFGP